MRTDKLVGATPGPWHVEPEEWTEGRGIAICGKDGAVAIIDAEMAPNGEDYANARLIAAAPELLDALREFVSDIEAAYSSGMDILKNAWPDLVVTYQNAQAAIAKAGGKEAPCPTK
jgi:hypothetical protein